MKVDGNRVELNQSELDDASCPRNPAWGAAMIRSFGLSTVADSKRMAHFAKCPDVLERAGYEVTVVEDAAEAEPLRSGPLESPERGGAPQPQVTPRGVVGS